jgi:glycerophosphoryl diester phosphodiesterase
MIPVWLLLASLSLANPPTTEPSPSASARIAHLLAELHDPSSSTVMVVAHRTAWKYAPENSVPGIQLCIDMGVDMIETDLQKTRDGRFVLMHDKSVDRTTTGTGLVSDLTLAQIQQLHLRDSRGKPTNETVPTLEQLIDLSRGHVLLYLDKTEDCIDQVYQRLVELNAVNFCVFYGVRTNAQLRAKYGQVMDHITYLPKVYDTTTDMPRYITDLGRDLAPPVFVIEFTTRDSLVLQNIPLMKQMHARVWASPLWPTAVAAHTDDLALKNPDANWGWMMQHGVNMFCTDRPREMLAYLRAKGLHE